MPFSYYFAFLIAIFVCSAVASIVYVDQQSSRDARKEARASAAFASDRAAKKLAQDITLLKTTVGNLAANPGIVGAAAHPLGCTLTYAGLGGSKFDHLDLITPNGSAVCSSRTKVHGKLSGYAGQPWISAALAGPTFRAPRPIRRPGARRSSTRCRRPAK